MAMTLRQLRLKNSKPSETASSPQAQSLDHSRRERVENALGALANAFALRLRSFVISPRPCRDLLLIGGLVTGFLLTAIWVVPPDPTVCA